MSGDAFADVLLVSSRLLWYAGCLGIIGAAAFWLLVAPAGERRSLPLDRSAARTGLIAAAVLLSGALARLYAQTYVSFGVEEPITLRLMLEVATDLPPWSTGWRWQFTAGAVSVIGFLMARAGRRAGWMIACLAALAVAASAPLTGHAVAQPESYLLPVALQAAHVLGAGMWIGGLFVMFAVAIAASPGSGHDGGTSLALLVNAFSPMAMVAAGLLATTGLVTAFLYLNAVADLWTTPYGRTLLVKVALFAAVALMGFVNWRFVRPRLSSPAEGGVLWRTAAVELTLAAFVLALTAMLVGMPQPGE
jgi:putative copper export protein